jgi:hypothetical protein
MVILKHIGKMKTNGAKVLVVFRTLPGDSNYALVVGTSNLSDTYHNAIIQLVESAQAQDTSEFGDILSIRHFPDGRLMLEALHADGKLIKVPTADVLMTPDTSNTIALSELNTLIAEQKGVAVDDLASFIGEKKKDPSELVKPPVTPPSDVTKTTSASVNETSQEPEVLSEKDLARKFRSQADAMYKEAAKLRKQADEIDPPQKKAVKVKEESNA